MKLAVQCAAEAFKTWKKTSIMSRQAKMFALQGLIKRDMDKLGAVITAELGKTQADAKGDVLRGLRTWGACGSSFDACRGRGACVQHHVAADGRDGR